MAKFVRCDVSKVRELETRVDEAEGSGGLDIMVNNSGVLLKEPILAVTEETYHRMQDVNVKSVYLASNVAKYVMGTSLVVDDGYLRI